MRKRSERTQTDILLFGEDGIVSFGAVGVTVLDELLNPVRTILDRPLPGALAGGCYWYLENGDLRRIRTDRSLLRRMIFRKQVPERETEAKATKTDRSPERNRAMCPPIKGRATLTQA